MSKNLFAAAVAAAGLAASASAAVTITQGPTAPAYANTLTFDEPGGATGVNVPSNSWVGMGITSIVSGEGSNFVGPNAFPTAQSTNSYYGPYGVFIRFATDLTAASFNAWDSSGPPTFSGGGMAVVLINDGDENNPVGFDFFTPAYGGFGDSAFNITTSGGMVFDEIRVLGFGFFPETYVDNVSWNAVPAPSAAALLSLAGLGLVRRRRN